MSCANLTANLHSAGWNRQMGRRHVSRFARRTCRCSPCCRRTRWALTRQWLLHSESEALRPTAIIFVGEYVGVQHSQLQLVALTR